MGKILLSGNCCLDMVTYLPFYPAEDSDLRNLDQICTLGGNATNSAKVLTQLGPPGSVLLFSAIPDKNALYESLFSKYCLDTSLCVVRSKAEEEAEGGVPVCICLVNERNGSRTLFSSLGNKRWPNGNDLRVRLPSLNGFSWLHFETGHTVNKDEVVQMVQYVHSLRDQDRENSAVVISIEFEHPVEPKAQSALIAMADVIFVSKDFAKHHVFCSMEECVEQFQERFGARHATVICPWGEKGVAAKCGTSARPASLAASGTLTVPAHFPSSGAVVDTLAAGDCFIAGAVHFLNAGVGLRESLEKATWLAGESVGKRGLAGLRMP